MSATSPVAWPKLSDFVKQFGITFGKFGPALLQACSGLLEAHHHGVEGFRELTHEIDSITEISGGDSLCLPREVAKVRMQNLDCPCYTTSCLQRNREVTVGEREDRRMNRRNGRKEVVQFRALAERRRQSIGYLGGRKGIVQGLERLVEKGMLAFKIAGDLEGRFKDISQAGNLPDRRHVQGSHNMLFQGFERAPHGPCVLFYDLCREPASAVTGAPAVDFLDSELFPRVALEQSGYESFIIDAYLILEFRKS